MGRADRHIQKQQELRQRSSILRPWENRPTEKGWLGYICTTNNIEGQLKMAEALISKKKHR